MGRLVVRRIRFSHCKRGPARCVLCREIDRDAPCLIELFPPGSGQAQRRVIEAEVDGHLGWYEFEVVRVFDGDDEAHNFESQLAQCAGSP